MRNIAFVITLYMLSMFSIHAQHSYYKFDKELQALVALNVTNNLQAFTSDSSNATILRSNGNFHTISDDTNAKKGLEIHSLKNFSDSKLNQISDILNSFNYVKFKNFTESSSLFTIDLSKYSNFEYVIINSYKELPFHFLIQELNKINVSDNTSIIYIQSLAN